MPRKELKIRIEKFEARAERKDFKTGKSGYGFYGQINIDGIPHRVNLNIIEIKGVEI